MKKGLLLLSNILIVSILLKVQQFQKGIFLQVEWFEIIQFNYKWQQFWIYTL